MKKAVSAFPAKRLWQTATRRWALRPKKRRPPATLIKATREIEVTEEIVAAVEIGEVTEALVVVVTAAGVLASIRPGIEHFATPRAPASPGESRCYCRKSAQSIRRKHKFRFRCESRLAHSGVGAYIKAVPTVVSITDKEQRQLWTADDFLDWLNPGIHADLIDGEKFMHSPVNFKHANLLNFVHLLLGMYVEKRKLGRVYREVVAVRLSTRNVFLPDLCFFTNEQVLRLAPAHAQFAPSLVVEALSPWSADRDVGPKFAAYEEHGVQEYWVL